MNHPVTVVKCGGSPEIDREAMCADIAALAAGGHRVVLVHGGAAEVDRLADRLGVPQRRLTTPSGSSSRYTDPATLEVLQLALAGKVKPALVAALGRGGARAVGLTGLDGRTVTARRTAAHRAVLDGRKVMIRDDHNGRISRIDPALLRLLLDDGIVPVLSPPALAEDGAAVNVDADRTAAAVAVALGAARLVLLTGAPGVLADHRDESSLLPGYEVPAEGPVGDAAVGGMKAKLQAARDALLGGVAEVLVADGRTGRPVSAAIEGAGTTVRTTAARDTGGAAPLTTVGSR
ncbi:[LysW]-aminoadipate kinase [Streptomyces sp. ms191]|uniref:[LysW]-aminoadipate kinase n=1 Tax=Streptomyces sp. ms191 TaxID=1827978 RepID=UPI0011CE8BB5|nr:[LysW]-aminoadipate kinase [Streptomyces sp. ms191]TXS22018.1 [LysW]-aminoadipate kinase [Streptomyces sp. ms191]